MIMTNPAFHAGLFLTHPSIRLRSLSFVRQVRRGNNTLFKFDQNLLYYNINLLWEIGKIVYKRVLLLSLPVPKFRDRADKNKCHNMCKAKYLYRVDYSLISTLFLYP
jgi:hypothetical protein